MLEETPGLMYAIYVSVFLGALLAFEGLRALFSTKEDIHEARNRRMRMIAKGSTTEEVLKLLLKNKPSGSILDKVSRSLSQSGLPIRMRGLFAMMVLGGVVVYFAAQRYVETPQAVMLAFMIATLVPTMVISGARRRRLEKLTKQLPDALDVIARGLKVGHPLNVTIGNVAKEMPDPIGTEFGIVQDQVSYGDNIVDAFSDMAERLDLEDIRYLAVTVGIQHGTGGNLARVLQVLSQIIRDRAAMRKKIHAISAEGRISAFILSVLPFMIYGMINMTTPSFYADVSNDPVFYPIMGLILGLVLTQAFILFKMVNFKF